MAQVCITLSAAEDTERNFVTMVNTADRTGTAIYYMIIALHNSRGHKKVPFLNCTTVVVRWVNQNCTLCTSSCPVVTG